MNYTHAEVAEGFTEAALDYVTRNMDADDMDEYKMALLGRVVIRNIRKYLEQKREAEDYLAEEVSMMRASNE